MLQALILVLGSLLPQAPAPAPAPTPAAVTPNSTFDSVIVIGGSVSDGYGLMPELGTRVSYADFLRVALGKPTGKFYAYGDSRFFQQPVGYGQKQVQKSLRSKPSLVVAIDFPFWYGYGFLANCEQRLAQLEQCFVQLERFECPVLVGNFPDMTPALKGSSPLMGGGPMLLPQQIPDSACRGALNKRLHAWVAQHANVHLFPLNSFVDSVRSKSTFEFRGIRYEPEQKVDLLQSDLLHPNTKGTVASALYTLHTLAEIGLLDGANVTWDAAALEKAMYAETREAREQAKAKREERKRARAAKQKAKQKAKKEKQDKQTPADEDQASFVPCL